MLLDKKIKKKILLWLLIQGQHRIDFCQRFQCNNFNDVFISDATCLQLTISANQLKILSRENVAAHISNFPIKIMVWGVVSQYDATPLCIIDCTINGAKYCEILKGFLLETTHALYPQGWSFQEANVRYLHYSLDIRLKFGNNSMTSRS